MSSSELPTEEEICPNCRRSTRNHRPWCETVTATEPPKAGDIVDHPLLGPTPIVSVCTRQQLIEDGELVDCTQELLDEVTRNAAIIADVAMTKAAFERYVQVPPAWERLQDVKGRYWDILTMFNHALRRRTEQEDPTVLFHFLCHPNGVGKWSNERADVERLTRVELKAMLHDGDRGEPCITFMLPSED